jgi:hypothetical protein
LRVLLCVVEACSAADRHSFDMRRVAGFYQIVAPLPRIYKVELPTAVKSILDPFFVFVNAGVDFSDPLQCVGLAGYVPELLFWMIFPIVISVFIVLLVLLSAAWTNHLKTGSGSGANAEVPEVWERVLPYLLMLAFMIYPRVNLIAFKGFDCHWFENVGGQQWKGWLTEDVSIECDTPDHGSVKVLAWLAVIMYPIGVCLGVAYLLWKAKPTPG